MRIGVPHVLEVHSLNFLTCCSASWSLYFLRAHCLIFPTPCSASWTPRISGSAFVLHFRRFVLRTGVPPFWKVQLLIFPTCCSSHRSPRLPESYFLRFPTFCSAHRSPIILESALFDISDVLFCAQESKNQDLQLLRISALQRQRIEA